MKIINLVGKFPINQKAVQPKKRKLDQVKYFVIHNSASSTCTPEDLYQWHTKERNWAVVGYHYLVRKDGTIYKLNYGSTISNHVAGYNTICLGICLELNGDKEHMTSLQFEALIDLLVYLKPTYPKAEIAFHRDFPKAGKTCPGLMIHKENIVEEFKKRSSNK